MGLVDDIKNKIDVSCYRDIDRVVLAYSGGVDTSIMIKLLQDVCDAEVIAVTLDLGQEEYSKHDKSKIKSKAESLGAEHYFIDSKSEFVTDYVWMGVKANCMYQGAYPNSTALGRPLIAKHLVEIAKKEKAAAIAHGSTGKGNDQVRFDVSISSLAPEMKIIAPVRDWNLARDEEMEYARENGIAVPVKKACPYSIDANIWGRSIECGILEDPGHEPPEDVFEWVKVPEKAKDTATEVTLHFEKGVPVKIECNGDSVADPLAIVTTMNEVAGENGVGIIDHMEDRTIGLKSREVYECPAALPILAAHADLEKYVLTREENEFKPMVDKTWSEFVYKGLWYSPLMGSLNAFIDDSQKRVTGWVRMKLYKGSMRVTGRGSANALYDKKLATYDKHTTFDQTDAKGFIKLWGMNTVIAKKVNG